MNSITPTDGQHAPQKPVVLCILDGWGCADPRYQDFCAPCHAKTPTITRLMAEYGMGRLATSGLDVGLPEGQMGNSEVGHMNIGCGRVVMQELPRIDAAIADGSLAKHPALTSLSGICHLVGLCSPGGVHAHQEHLVALANILANRGLTVWLHLISDGRDTPPRSVMEFWQALQPRLKHPNIRVATLSGRYYAMDRDKRWDRVEKAWRAMVLADAPRQGTVEAAITASYAEGLDDEFILPVVMEGYTGVQPGDHVLFANFRADRARQLSHALMDPRFDGFARGSATLAWGQKIAMVEYSTVLAGLYDVVLFPPERLSDSLGEVVSRAGLKQFRIAETEKYAHVTFFFNGGKEDLFPGEERKLIPSPKVATYDLQPEMSAPEVTDALVAAIQSGEYALLVVNYANPDMVGHTGNMAAAIKAVECVDHCLARLMEAVDAMGGVLVISADHGNVEQMFDPATNQAHTAHTTGPVPLIVASRALGRPSLANGRLADIAPTLLHLLGLPQPAAMNGRNLLAASSPVQTGKRVHA